MTILPLAYLGGTEWFSLLSRGDSVIDVGENWVGQTFRNRAEILMAGGGAALTVPVHVHVHGCGPKNSKIPTKEVRIDNSKRWQHTHWVSMVSAYRNSPFFDHYEERFAPMYEKKFDFLIDLDLELLNIVAAALGLTDRVKISENYIAASPADLDMRGKKAFRRQDGSNGAIGQNAIIRESSTLREFPEYVQVFADRTPFIPGLSVVDLLFCEGSSARELLLPRDRR